MVFDLQQMDVPFRMQPGLRKMTAGERHLRALRPDGALYREKQQVVASSRCFLRSERQTIFPVPGRDGAAPQQIVFTITGGLQPLPDAVRDADGAWRLLRALESMTDAVLADKRLASARAPLTAWLSHQAAVLPPGPAHNE